MTEQADLITRIPKVQDARQAMRFAVNPINYLEEKHKEHGRFFFTKLGVRDVCILSSNTAIGKVLLNKEGSFVQSSATHLLDYFLGKGILTVEGEAWKTQRKRLLPYFSVKSVSSNIERYGAIASSTIQEWDTSSEINLLKSIKQISISVILSLITERQPDQQMVEAFQVGTDTVMEFINMTRNPFAMRKFAGNIHQEMIDRVSVVDDNIYKLLENVSSPIINKMKAEGVNLKAIRDEIVTLIAAGYESTAHSITSSIYFIERHPEVKRKLMEEVEELFHGHTDIFKLRYTMHVVKESMRLHPPGWMFFRKSAEEVELDDYIIPKETDVMINVYNLHRDPKIWEQADEFIPERFEQERDFPEHAFIPFGTGVRFCIGRNLALQEIVYILAYLYKNYKVNVQNVEQYNLKPDITLGLGGPFLANLTPFN